MSQLAHEGFYEHDEPSQSGNAGSAGPQVQGGEVVPLFGKYGPENIAPDSLEHEPDKVEPVEEPAEDTSWSQVEPLDFDFPLPLRFHFDEHRIRGTTILPASHDARVRAVMEGMRATHPEYPELSMRQIRGENSISAKLNTYVNSRGANSVNNKDLLSLDDAIRILVYDDFMPANHPTWHALYQFNNIFRDIGAGLRAQVDHTIIVAFHAPEIRDVYRRLLPELRKQRQQQMRSDHEN